MQPHSRFPQLGQTARRPALAWWTLSTLRRAALIASLGVMAGCAQDVVLRDPQTGATEVCRQSLAGLNPWSQTMACVGDHMTRGWTLTDRN